MLVTEIASITVKLTPLLVMPSSVIVTEPLVALDGTPAVILVSLQELTDATTPLNDTWLLPWLAPKPLPAIVINPPICAAGGVRLLIAGLIVVNVTFPGLELELTVTTTGPGPAGVVLATVATICELLQLVIDDAATLSKLTVLLPCEEPKFEPVIVTDVPVAPRLGATPVTKGVVPTLTETLSNVDVASAEVLLLLTAKPT
jgi:hypothetical protein